MHPKLKVNFTAKFNFFVGFCSFSCRRRGEKTNCAETQCGLFDTVPLDWRHYLDWRHLVITGWEDSAANRKQRRNKQEEGKSHSYE